MLEPLSKAAGFVSFVDALRKTLPRERFEAMRAALPSDVAALVDSPPLVMGWLSTRHFTVLLRTVTRVAFDGDTKRLVEVGRAQFRADLSSLYKVFIRLSSPHFVADRAGKLYETYARNNGAMTATRKGDAESEIRVTGVVAASPEWWAYLQGTISGALEASGVRDLSVELREGGGSGDSAVFRAAWRAN